MEIAATRCFAFEARSGDGRCNSTLSLAALDLFMLST